MKIFCNAQGEKLRLPILQIKSSQGTPLHGRTETGCESAVPCVALSAAPAEF